MTVDGKIATSTGKSRWITGTESRREVHKMRARSSAVMVGVGTLLADDATLTARLSPPPPVQPMRIVVDSRLRTPVDCSAVRAISEEAQLLIATTEGASYDAGQRLIDVGAEVLRLPSTDNRVDLRHLMRALAERSIISILVEGGAELNASLIRGNLAQRMVVFVAPLLFGGKEARTPVEGGGIDQVESAIRLGKLVSKRYGADVTLEADIVPSGVSGS